jgi:NAD(P)-dependent dehydrogenase (short-subunit alcohol dehydrogenase family)
MTSTATTARVALVTGANTGIGLVTARELARQGYRVWVACRSPERGKETVEHVRRESGGRADFLELDLSDLDSVRRAAATFLAQGSPLHLLVNNAGLAGTRGLSKSGFEIAFGVNHIGHFVLTRLLLDRLKESAPARIVTVASKGHYRASAIPWETLRSKTRSVTGVPEYNVSKLANVLFSAELSRKLASTGVTTYSLHPGVVASDVWRKVPWPIRPLIKGMMITVEEGAKTTLHCATSPDAASESGLYYDRCRVKEPSALARDERLATELWTKSEAWTAS